MARKTKMPVGSPVFWPLEAALDDLLAYMNSRLGRPFDEIDASQPVPIEPTWFQLAFDASWPVALAEAAAL